jgi:hypothetical protein
MHQVVRAGSFRLKNPGTGLYRFMDEESYGQRFSFAPPAPKNTRDRLLTLGRGYAIIKEEEGKLVLNRQSRIYPLLQIMMDDIMEHERELSNPGVDAPLRKAVEKTTVVESLQKLQLDNKTPVRKQNPKVEVKASVQDLQSLPKSSMKRSATTCIFSGTTRSIWLPSPTNTVSSPPPMLSSLTPKEMPAT